MARPLIVSTVNPCGAAAFPRWQFFALQRQRALAIAQQSWEHELTIVEQELQSLATTLESIMPMADVPVMCVLAEDLQVRVPRS